MVKIDLISETQVQILDLIAFNQNVPFMKVRLIGRGIVGIGFLFYCNTQNKEEVNIFITAEFKVCILSALYRLQKKYVIREGVREKGKVKNQEREEG